MVHQRRRSRRRDRLAGHRLGRRGRSSGPRASSTTTTGSATRSPSKTRASRRPSTSRREDLLHRQVRVRRHTAIVDTDQKTTMDPMFNADVGPECWMQKVPTWYGPDFFPDQRAAARCPSTWSATTSASCRCRRSIPPEHVEGSADTMMVSGQARVRAVIEFLATPRGLQRWIEAGSAIRPTSTPPLVRRGLQAGRRIGHREQRIRHSASTLRTSCPVPSAPARSGPSPSTGSITTVRTPMPALKAIDDSWPHSYVCEHGAPTRRVGAPRRCSNGGEVGRPQSSAARTHRCRVSPAVPGLVALGACVGGILVLIDPAGGQNLLARIYDSLGNTRRPGSAQWPG